MDESYDAVLQYKKRMKLLSIPTYVVILSVLMLLAFSYILFSSTVQTIGELTFMFITLLGYLIYMIITYIDAVFNLGMFYEKKSINAAFTFIIAFILSAVMSGFTYFGSFFSHLNQDLIISIYIISLIYASGATTYFLYIGNPNNASKDIIDRFADIKAQLKGKRISNFGLNEVINRALRWVEFQQTEEGFWSATNPLYETAEVLRMFVETDHALDYSWKKIVNGVEEQRTVEQVFYIVLDAVDNGILAVEYEKLIPFLSIAEVDPSLIKIADNKELNTYYELIRRMSPWDFIKELETLSSIKNPEIPPIFPLGILYRLVGDTAKAQLFADVLSEAYNIVLNRSRTRFTARTEEKSIDPRYLAMIYNTLLMLLKPPVHAAETTTESEATDFSLPDISLPGMEIDNVGSAISDIKVEVSLSKARRYLLQFQQLDGSWGGSLRTTAEALQVITHRESIESESVKIALYFILALQKKNGSWSDDISTTCAVIKVLHSILSNVIVV